MKKTRTSAALSPPSRGSNLLRGYWRPQQDLGSVPLIIAMENYIFLWFYMVLYGFMWVYMVLIWTDNGFYPLAMTSIGEI